MKISLAFCKLAYETIIGEKLPDNKPYAQAAREARAKDPQEFFFLHKQFQSGELPAQQ